MMRYDKSDLSSNEGINCDFYSKQNHQRDIRIQSMNAMPLKGHLNLNLN